MGAIPKRSDQRRRRNEPARPVVRVPVAAAIEPPAGDPGWHPLAADWYASLAGSGQSTFYEPSDWQVARWCALLMSSTLAEPKLNAAALGAVRDLMTDLLCTEASRRRVQVEVTRVATALPPGVPSLDDYRTRLEMT